MVFFKSKCFSFVGYGVFSAVPVTVHKEMLIQFETSDMQWIVFVSEPTEFVCSNKNQADTIAHSGDAVYTNPPNWEIHSPHFDLRATKPMKKGMIRVAMSNNCTTGQFQAQCKRNDRCIAHDRVAALFVLLFKRLFIVLFVVTHFQCVITEEPRHETTLLTFSCCETTRIFIPQVRNNNTTGHHF